MLTKASLSLSFLQWSFVLSLFFSGGFRDERWFTRETLLHEQEYDGNTLEETLKV